MTTPEREALLAKIQEQGISEMSPDDLLAWAATANLFTWAQTPMAMSIPNWYELNRRIRSLAALVLVGREA